MKQILRILLCASVFSTSLACATEPFTVERLDPSLDSLIASDAKLEKVFEGDTFFEGPTWNNRGGYLIFSDVPGNVINKLGRDGKVSVLLGDIFTAAGLAQPYESLGANKVRMPGANGTTLDARGRLVYCSYSDGQIVRLEKDGKRTILASKFGEHRINAPNDLVYASDGTLYFTDSRIGTPRTDGAGIPHEGVYAIKAGAVQLLSKDIDHPNGVALSPDEKYLYVTNSRVKNILRFEVQASGITNERVFVDMKGDPRPGVPDGLKADTAGNIYSTGPGGIWIMSKDGTHIGTIPTPSSVTNVALGDADRRTLYITGSGALYRFRLKRS